MAHSLLKLYTMNLFNFRSLTILFTIALGSFFGCNSSNQTEKQQTREGVTSGNPMEQHRTGTPTTESKGNVGPSSNPSPSSSLGQVQGQEQSSPTPNQSTTSTTTPSNPTPQST